MDAAVIVALVLGLGGWVFAGWQGWLAHRERTATLRRILYERRFEAIQRTLADSAELLWSMIVLCQKKDQAARDAEATKSQAYFRALVRSVFECMAILPKGMTESCAKVLLSSYQVLSAVRRGDDEVNTSRLAEAVFAFANAGRQALQVDELGAEIQSLLKQAVAPVIPGDADGETGAAGEAQ